MSLFGNKPKFCDETLTCRICGKPFVYPAEQQEFFAAKGVTAKPTTCPECKKAQKVNADAEKKQLLQQALRDPSVRKYYRCSWCGKTFTVTAAPAYWERMCQRSGASPCPLCNPELWKLPPFAEDLQLNKALGLPK